MGKVTRLVELLLPKLAPLGPVATVLSPAMGGLVLGQEVARQTGARFIFAEKVEDRLVLRRNFKISPSERVLVVEDVVTRGGRVVECLEIIAAARGTAAGVAALVDRSDGTTTFSAPFASLLRMSFPTYPADALPPGLAGIPAVKPGS